MGIAAYNRGSRAIRAQFDREAEERRRAVVSRGAVPFTLRPLNGEWWVLNKREHGFASFGYPFAFLGDALDKYGLTLTSFGCDKHGLYLEGRNDAVTG